MTMPMSAFAELLTSTLSLPPRVFIGWLWPGPVSAAAA
jgi:hypothetical protein